MTTWKDRIHAAAERGRFTKDDKASSGDWRHCACGEVREALMQEGGPLLDTIYPPITPNHTEELRRVSPSAANAERFWDLGRRFYHAVDYDDVEEAQRIYDAIHEEVAKIASEEIGIEFQVDQAIEASKEVREVRSA